ncbi:hypothetical protein RHGRI_022728 [Rhododendron griersonianum]|uniref:Uncharacterized protein n=1 Tax=Rhododendron griersonianum TaxID=479676 RepID=A0AAV6J2C7_9ERIC|nr:hypothetical protein RHGRI_022728 [Rhododendron griersonianum]
MKPVVSFTLGLSHEKSLSTKKWVQVSSAPLGQWVGLFIVVPKRSMMLLSSEEQCYSEDHAEGDEGLVDTNNLLRNRQIRNLIRPLADNVTRREHSREQRLFTQIEMAAATMNDHLQDPAVNQELCGYSNTNQSSVPAPPLQQHEATMFYLP